MTRNAAFRLFALFALAGATCAQESARQYSLSGTVVNSQTGEPVVRAMVRIVALNRGVALRTDRGTPSRFTIFGDDSQFTTFADKLGTFTFSGLQPGVYAISAQKPGFTVSPDGRADQVELTSSIPDFQLKLVPLGAISGHVLDQNGEPLRGVSVVALTTTAMGGFRRIHRVRTVTSNDQGAYRLWNMQPGKYYVKAAGRSGGTRIVEGDTTAPFHTDSFAPTYFGGARKFDSAAPIEIGPGSDIRADLKLSLAPAYTIRGVLRNLVPSESLSLELLSDGDDVSASRVNVNGYTGQFEVVDVLPGSYALRATQGNARAELTLTVGESDLAGVVAPLAPAVDIPVLSRYIGAPQPGSNPGVGMRRLSGVACSASLHPTGREDDEGYFSEDAIGKTVLSGVFPGAYRFSATCVSGYVHSAMFGAQDLLLDPIIKIAQGDTPPAVEIAGVYGGGRVTGTFASEGAAKLPRPAVLLAPRGEKSSGAVLSMVYFDENATGRFSFSGVAPGEYAAYGFPDADEVEYLNPDFLRSLRGGVTVRVQDNAETKITITAVAQ